MAPAAPGTDAALPVVLVVSATEFKYSAGRIWREVAAGAVVRIDDLRECRTLAWLSAEPPASAGDLADYLPMPGEVADRPAPDSEAGQ